MNTPPEPAGSDGQGGGIAISGGNESFVVEVKHYQTSGGQQLVEHVCVLGSLPAGRVRFYGHAEANVQIAGAPPIAPVQFQFPMDGVESLEQAVREFDQRATEFANEQVVPQIKKQIGAATQPGIQIAGAGDMPPLGGGPNGLSLQDRMRKFKP